MWTLFFPVTRRVLRACRRRLFFFLVPLSFSGLQSARYLMACDFVFGLVGEQTKPELQAVERTLLEERANLHKVFLYSSSSSDMLCRDTCESWFIVEQDMEVLRRAVEELRADNRKLEVSTTTYACLRLFRHFPLLPCSVGTVYPVMSSFNGPIFRWSGRKHSSYRCRALGHGSCLPVNCGFGCC